MPRTAGLAFAVLCLVALTPFRALAQAPAAEPESPKLEAPTDLQLRADAEQALRADIARLRRERSEISQTGPALMMIFGYVFAPLVLIGVPLLVIGDVCDVDNTDCVNLVPAGAVLTGLGLAGAAVGIAGLVMALENGDERKRLDTEIEDRERDLQHLSYGIALGPDHATFRLRWAL